MFRTEYLWYAYFRCSCGYDWTESYIQHSAPWKPTSTCVNCNRTRRAYKVRADK